MEKICKNCGCSFSIVETKNKRKLKKEFCVLRCAASYNGKNNIGRVQSDETKELKRQKSIGERNHFFGKKHSAESLEKMSLSMTGKNTGPLHYNWKGGIREGSEYLRYTDGSFVHRKIMETKIGRKLEIWENVHHKDENKRNNDPDNLEILTNSDHRKLHAKTQKRNEYGKFSA